MIERLVRKVDEILRGRVDARAWPLALGCGLFYGAVMGSFDARPLQVAYSAIKVPILLLATLSLGLPSYFVLNTVLGLRNDFREAWRIVAASQAAFMVALSSLAPLTAFWYASTDDYPGAVLANTVMFAVASLGAQLMLYRGYRPLIDRNPRHRWLLRVWIFLYAFIGIQMGWNLRPFVGNPAQPTGFFRPEPWENAYIDVSKILWRAVSPSPARGDR